MRFAKMASFRIMYNISNYFCTDVYITLMSQQKLLTVPLNTAG